ncbi:MAG: nucleoside recognition domain-containing protein [Clostridia bacterium]|nr:nucleoside recognition domain-containing protein [Clostridia bacterium]
MLNIIWPIFLIVSFIYAILNGRVAEVNNSIFESTKSAVELCISLLGTICLWNGIMQIAAKTKIVKHLTKILNPIMKKLFPDIKRESKIHEEISMNIIANIMGLGNAATPLGLKAMKSMQKENKEKNRLSNSMAIFIVLNTASIQIIPTTVIAIRSALSSNNPTGMIIPVWISTVLAAGFAIISAKLLMKKF